MRERQDTDVAPGGQRDGLRCAQPNVTPANRWSGCFGRTSTNAMRWSGNALARGREVFCRGKSGLVRRLGSDDLHEATFELTVTRVENLSVEGYVFVRVNAASTEPVLNDAKHKVSTFAGATVCTKITLRKRGTALVRRSIVVSVVHAHGARRPLSVARIDVAQYILSPGGQRTPVRITLPSGIVIVGTLSCTLDPDVSDNNAAPRAKRCATFSIPRQSPLVHPFVSDRPISSPPRRYSFGGRVNRGVLPWRATNAVPVPRPPLSTAFREQKLPSALTMSSITDSHTGESIDDSDDQINKCFTNSIQDGLNKHDAGRSSLSVQEHPKKNTAHITKDVRSDEGKAGENLEEANLYLNSINTEGLSDSDNILNDDDSDSSNIENEVSTSNSGEITFQYGLESTSLERGSEAKANHREKISDLERENRRLSMAIAALDTRRANQMVLVRENAWLKRQMNLLKIAVIREPTMKEVITELRWTHEAMMRTSIQHDYLSKRVGRGTPKL